GAAYLNGEVWSGIREPVDFVRITANARDAQGTLIWTDWAYAMVDVMEYGQRSPFRMIDWGVLTDIDTMEFVVEWDTAGPSHIGQILEVISSRVVSTGGRIEYVGEARNNTGRVVEYPKAVIGIYNGPGQIIGADWTYGSPTEVQPGETTTFSGSVSGYCGGGGLYLLQVVADYWDW
ncbi:MAG: FxLYD domain-containing protein, partial [Anaerolineae bacterium]|nr:FxLYD domain-containing protein [Anaerolineae bacterium]